MHSMYLYVWHNIMNTFSYIQSMSKIHHRESNVFHVAMLMNKIYDIPTLLTIIICLLQFN